MECSCQPISNHEILQYTCPQFGQAHEDVFQVGYKGLPLEPWSKPWVVWHIIWMYYRGFAFHYHQSLYQETYLALGKTHNICIPYTHRCSPFGSIPIFISNLAKFEPICTYIYIYIYIHITSNMHWNFCSSYFNHPHPEFSAFPSGFSVRIRVFIAMLIPNLWKPSFRTWQSHRSSGDGQGQFWWLPMELFKRRSNIFLEGLR